jgi:folate-binding protein YgfZ
MTVGSYGDVTAEYHALHSAAAVIDGQHLMVRVAGADAQSFLDSLLSQDLTGLDDGRVVRSLLLGPRGKLRALLWVARLGEAFLLVADPEPAASVVADLTRFKLRVDVVIDPPVPAVDLLGPGADELIGSRLGEGPRVALSAPLGSLSRHFILHAGLDEVAAAGARPVGLLAHTAVRVEMGEPVMGVDVDEATIPQEAGLEADAVSFTKGCYLGQELVARIDSRGHVNRYLRGVVLAENVLPPEGADVIAGEATVGSITSVSESLRVGAPVGLGLIRREVTPGTGVEIRWPGGSAAAEIRTLPLV